MNKEGQMVKSWKRRWFIVENGILEYFTDETQTVCKGRFELSEDLDIVEDPRELAVIQSGMFRSPKSFMFALRTSKRILFLAAESSGDREKWMAYFRKCIENFRDNKVERPNIMSQSYTSRNANPNVVYIYGQEENEDAEIINDNRPFNSSRVVLGDILGDGCFGKVFIASHDQEELAVKVFMPQSIKSSIDRRQILREVDFMNNLHFPYIAQFRGAYVLDNNLAIAMEFCEMGSLQKLIETTAISPAMKVKYALDTAKGMNFLHQNKILHCDLKPDNLLVFSVSPNSPVSIKVTDFGTDRYINLKSSNVLTKHVVYMSPEMLSGSAYSFPSDAYSYAVTLWELWSQQHAYANIMSEDALINFLKDQRLALSPDCLYNHIISGCWKNDPNERFTFTQVVEMFRNINVSMQ